MTRVGRSSPQGDRVHRSAPLTGTLRFLVLRRRVGTGDAAIENVLGPIGPRPVPLVVPARGVRKPTGRDTGERRAHAACRSGCWPSGGTLMVAAGERACRDLRPAVDASAAAAGRNRSYHQHGAEGYEENPRAVSVVHEDSVWPVAVRRSSPDRVQGDSLISPQFVDTLRTPRHRACGTGGRGGRLDLGDQLARRGETSAPRGAMARSQSRVPSFRTQGRDVRGCHRLQGFDEPPLPDRPGNDGRLSR